MSQFRRVVCGISGGVDSAVAAYLLKRKRFEVIGLFMKNWDNRDELGTCITAEEELQDARSICDHLQIPMHEVSFVKEYWNNVFSTLLEDYENGLTPNPDILCNRFVKFGSFFNYAFDNMGADAIATGHYAKSSFGCLLESYKENLWADLKRAEDPSKDQTLFLSAIPQKALRKTMFPLGDLFKFQVREIAKNIGLNYISKKPDSVGICFIGDRRFSHFVSEYISNKPGLFINLDTNEVVGQHNGVHQWTIGQKCKIGGLKSSHYVVNLDPKTQQILVVSSRDHPALYTNEVLTAQPYWISNCPLTSSTTLHCMFKFQHTEWTVPCQVRQVEGGRLLIHLLFYTRAITPGQHAVFYQKDTCLGSAKILSSKRRNEMDCTKISNTQATNSSV